MFTALILICASGIKDSEACYINVHDEMFNSRYDCDVVVKEAMTGYSDFFEWYDESTQENWKITDYQCVNWLSMKVRVKGGL